MPVRSSMGAYALMVLVALLFAGGFVSGKVAVASVAPEFVAFIRFAIAATIMILLVARISPTELRLQRRDVPLLLGIGLTAVAGYNLLLLWGFRLAQASDGGMVVPTVAPLATMLLASVFFHEALTARKLGGALICVVGQILIFYGLLANFNATPGRGWGALVFTAAALCWAAYGLLGRRVVGRVSPLAANAWGMVFGTGILLPFALWRLPDFDISQFTVGFWLNMSYLSLATTVLGFWLYYIAIRRIGAGSAALFLNMVPMMVVVMAGLILNERVETIQWVGMFLVVSGIVWANTQSHRQVSPAS